MYVCKYIRMYVYTYVCVCVCIYIYMPMYLCVYVRVCIYLCMCMCVFVYNSIITQVHTTWDDIGIEMVEEYDPTTDQLLLRKVLLVYEVLSC
jgi:hypothetical protein